MSHIVRPEVATVSASATAGETVQDALAQLNLPAAAWAAIPDGEFLMGSPRGRGRATGRRAPAPRPGGGVPDAEDPGDLRDVRCFLWSHGAETTEGSGLGPRRPSGDLDQLLGRGGLRRVDIRANRLDLPTTNRGRVGVRLSRGERHAFLDRRNYQSGPGQLQRQLPLRSGSQGHLPGKVVILIKQLNRMPATAGVPRASTGKRPRRWTNSHTIHGA